MGLTLGGLGGTTSTAELQMGTTSTAELQMGTCEQLLLSSHSHSQVQPAWAAGAATENNAEMVMIVMNFTLWTVGVGRGCASESRGELFSGLDLLQPERK